MNVRKKNPKGAGRKPGPKMPCGWCGKMMTRTEVGIHFTNCKKRPK